MSSTAATASATSSSFDIDELIPTGSWTLYFHSPEENKWTLNTFISLGTMRTWRDFWSVIDALRMDTINESMFFLMHDPIPPLWESHHNIHGGCYSFRCPKKDAADAFINYMIAAMIGKITIDPNNVVNGLTISPKRGFSIIKVWNTNQKVYNLAGDVVYGVHHTVKEHETVYTPFTLKKM